MLCDLVSKMVNVHTNRNLQGPEQMRLSKVRENIMAFLEAAVFIGVPRDILFEVEDVIQKRSQA